MFDFSSLLVSGISLIIVIFGLVEFSKSLGLKGKALTVFSMILGLFFGIAYKIAEGGVLPTDFAGWFAVIVFGLALGLVTCGIYDFSKSHYKFQDNEIRKKILDAIKAEYKG